MLINIYNNIDQLIYNNNIDQLIWVAHLYILTMQSLNECE